MNEAQQIMGVHSLPLSTPIKAHGAELSELEVRRPSSKEVREIGSLPYRLIDASGTFTPDMGVIPSYIVVCAGIPMSSVDQLDLPDLNQLAWGICSFFMSPASKASSS